jgi:hypothetical protein
MKESKALNIVLLVLKILLAAVLVGSLIFFTWMLIDAYVESVHMPPPENGTVQLDPFPIVFVLVLILSLVTNGACMVIALVGLILSICYKASPQRRKNIISFTVFLILPVLLELFYLLFYFLAS